MYRKLLKYLEGYRLPAVLTPIFTMTEVVVDVYIPYLMSKIIDVGLANGDRRYILETGGLMVLLAVVSQFLGLAAARCNAVSSSGFGKNLRSAMFEKIQQFSFSNVDKFTTGSLITRLTTDVGQIENAFRMGMRMMFRMPVMMILSTVMAYRINSRLCLVFVAAIPFLAIAMIIIMTKAMPHFVSMMEKFDVLNSVIEENLTGIRVVKAFVRKDKENEKFYAAASGIKKTQLAAEHIVILNGPIMSAVIYLTCIIIYWFGGKQMIAGTMLTGEFFTYIQYVRQILFGLNAIMFLFVGLSMAGASAQRIVEVLEEDPDIDDSEADPELQVEDGHVTFEDVCFTYKKGSDNYILQHIDLDIRSGEVIGIIGGTGSAKSTLVQLIPRLYDVNTGRVTVGGRDVRDYKTDNLRNACSMVLQKNLLFSGTIRDNLKWGKEDATDEEIIEACKAAQAHDFIMSFPNGYDTELGQGGVNVSGGQKQRLCIARALLKQPKILILDDSTSAVDTATDAAIRGSLRERFGDSTVFIIAQRIASVHDADRVIVLEDGKVNAFDTPENLLKNNEIYREVYESQQKGGEEDA